MAPELKHLKVELQHTQQGVIAWLTLNRPKALNALSGELLKEFLQLLDSWEHPYSLIGQDATLNPDAPRVIILQGAGATAFSSGVDIKASGLGIGGSAWNFRDMRSQQILSRLIQRLRAMPQPIIAAVDGIAAGGGLALAIASDVRVATRNSSFSAAFVRLGLTGSDMGSSFFTPRIAGLGIASEMLLTGRSISAERAYQVGMVNELVDTVEQMRAAAEKLAKEMLECSYLGLQLTKEQLNAVADGGSLRATVTAENSHQILLVNDPVASKQANEWMRKIASKSGRVLSKM